MALVIGADLGGTKLAAVLVNHDHEVVHRIWIEHSAKSYPDLTMRLASVVAQCERVAADHGTEVGAMGLAIAGWLSRDRERLLWAANLGARDEAIGADLRRRFGLPIVIDNDGNAAAMAEHRIGAGAGCNTLVLITLGTGVGGGIIVDGHPMIGALGLAGELGHLPVSGVEPCVCGGRGCLELLASGPAIARSAGATSAVEVVTSATGGDAVALAALTSAGRFVGEALARIIPVIDPDLVLLGGSLAHAAGDILMPAVRSALRDRRSLSRVAGLPRVSLAALGPEAGALGAAELVLQPAKSSTSVWKEP